MATEKKFPSSHWLFGDSRIIEIEVETKCSDCFHAPVCPREYEKRCLNYAFGTSEGRGCHSCTNHYARFCNKTPVPCFLCEDFIHKDKVKIIE